MKPSWYAAEGSCPLNSLQTPRRGSPANRSHMCSCGSNLSSVLGSGSSAMSTAQVLPHPFGGWEDFRISSAEVQFTALASARLDFSLYTGILSLSLSLFASVSVCPHSQFFSSPPTLSCCKHPAPWAMIFLCVGLRVHLLINKNITCM